MGCTNNSQVAGVVQSIKKNKVNIRNFVSLRNHKIDRKYVVVAPGQKNIIQQRRTKQWYKVIRCELGVVVLGQIEVIAVKASEKSGKGGSAITSEAKPTGEDPADPKSTEPSSDKGGG